MNLSLADMLLGRDPFPVSGVSTVHRALEDEKPDWESAYDNSKKPSHATNRVLCNRIIFYLESKPVMRPSADIAMELGSEAAHIGGLCAHLARNKAIRLIKIKGANYWMSNAAADDFS